MTKVIKIDGVLYRMVERSTLANDFYIMKQLRTTGIADCTPRTGESANEYALRLLYSVVENGAPFELLGGLLLPEGIPDEKWSQDQAEITAAMLGRLTDEKSKAEVQRVLIAILTDFFREGLRYLKPSPGVSTEAQPEQEPAVEPPPALNSSRTSVNGARWYERLPIIRWIVTRW
jgi:hypothetical protein